MPLSRSQSVDDDQARVHALSRRRRGWHKLAQADCPPSTSSVTPVT